MKKTILLSLVLFLSLSILSQEAIAASLHIGHSVYLPDLSPEEQTFPAGPIASVDDLKSLITGKFANSPMAGHALTLRDIRSDNIVFTIPTLGYRTLDADGLAYINGQLAEGKMVSVSATVPAGAIIHGNPAAEPPYNQDFALPAHFLGVHH
jgi:hypothetical protein